jgi:hypothetical protein
MSASHPPTPMRQGASSTGLRSRKTLSAHRLAGVHTRGAHYSSRRASSCGLAWEEARLDAPGSGRVRMQAIFEHPDRKDVLQITSGVI